MFAQVTPLLGLVAAASLAVAGPINILFKDVVIVGGGASGAYAAVRLRDDFHKSIALIEQQSMLVRYPSYIYFSFSMLDLLTAT